MHVAEAVPYVAVITALPSLTAVTTPEPETVATASLELANERVFVGPPTFAVRVYVSPAVNVKELGSKVTEGEAVEEATFL